MIKLFKFSMITIAVLVVFGVVYGVYSVQQWREEQTAYRTSQPMADPDCFVSERLRIEIGGHLFAIPREKLKYIYGPEVPEKIENYRIPGSWQNKYCQKASDPPFIAEKFMFVTRPNCDDKTDEPICAIKEMHIVLFDFSHLTLAKRKKLVPSKEFLSSNERETLFKDTVKIKVEMRFYRGLNYPIQKRERDSTILDKISLESLMNQIFPYYISLSKGD
jgi:hypothetical protein